MTERVESLWGRPGPGMSAAVRAGRTIWLAGQVATDETGSVVGEGDCTEQARQCFRNVERLLGSLQARMTDVVEVMAFLSDPSYAASYLKVRQEVFPDAPPATTTVVARLLDPRYLVEVRVVACVEGGD
jgi:enamine deaminase RidA (YjgF/YER057c/UK114 family)